MSSVPVNGPFPAAMRRRCVALGVALAATGGGAALAAPQAEAVDLLTCGGTVATSYSPPLTDTPQPVTTSTTTLYQPCVNVTNPLEFRTGISAATFGPSERSCQSLLRVLPGRQLIRWSTGGTSTFTFTTFITSSNGILQVTETGSITDGDFRGRTAVSVVAVLQTDLAACATTGVASVGGLATLTIAL